MSALKIDRRKFLRMSMLGAAGGLAFRSPSFAASSANPPFQGRRIIDIHTHVNFHGYNVHEVIENMDRFGIDIAWLLPWEGPREEFPPWDHLNLSPHKLGLPFEDVVRATELYPDRFVAAWAIDPRLPQAKDRLRAAVETYKVRVYGELKLRLMYNNLDLVEMFELCGELGLPVLFHLEVILPDPTGQLRVDLKDSSRRYWWGGQIDTIERVLQRCPDTIFIGHAPGFWLEISGDSDQVLEMYPGGPVVPGGKLLSLLDKYPNLYCDISAGSGLNALERDPKNARRFLIAHQDRILFGRDYFDAALLVFLKGLELPDPVLDKILSQNALRLVPFT